RSRFTQAGYAVVADGDKEIHRSGTFAPADAKRMALFQAQVLIINIQMFLPKDRSARLEIKGSVIRLVILVTLPGKKKSLTAG
ncbi:MAG: hypothetical protein CL389_10480, partial [Acidiferrobacteraceae bacterium]|nr:hypothetical protein [Acidiferrobacteraceae bacterium]MAF08262.1 hypothetical protein [Acidiferrobacteraceae bacterium]